MITSLRLRTARGLAALGGRIALWINRREVWLVSAIVIGFVCFQSVAALSRLWFDEMITFYLARLPSIGEMFRVMAPADGSPPLYHLLARVSMRVLGDTEFAVRLPSMLAFAGALLAIFFFIRRRRGAVFALFGMLALATSEIAFYGHEARPYALMLGFTGLAMVSWQAAGEESGWRIFPLAGVAAGVAGAVASHHLGVLNVGVPLLSGEAVRLVERRRLDFPMYAAGAAGLATMLFTAPFARESQRLMLRYLQHSADFWARPRLLSNRSYGNLVNLWLPVAFLLFLWLTKSAFPSGDDADTPPGVDKGVPAHEAVAVVALTLLVPIMIAVTWATTGYYQGRYAIGAAMGSAILMGIAVPIAGRSRVHSTSAAALCVALLLVVFAGSGTASAMERFAMFPNGNRGTGTLLDSLNGSEPIVVAGALNYLPMWWYASPPLRARLHYLADLPYATRQPDFLPELSLVAGQPFIPSPVDDYRQFLSSHTRFLLYCTGASGREWTRERLLSERWGLRVLGAREGEMVFLAEAPGQ
jgi:hypothetical protein